MQTVFRRALQYCFAAGVHFFVGGVAELYQAWITGALQVMSREIAESAADIVESSSLFFRRK